MDTVLQRWERLSPHLEIHGPADAEPRPAVLLIHGCGGVRHHLRGYAEEAAKVITDAQIAVVARHEAAFLAAAKDPPDPAAAVGANRDLHFALYEAAGMPSLIEMIGRLWLKAGPILNLDMRHEPRRLDGGSAVVAHAQLLAALRRRDPAAARQALVEDISAAAEHIERTARLAD